MEQKNQKPEPRPGEPRVETEGTRAPREDTRAAEDERPVKVERTEARQGQPRIMVRRTLIISLTLAVLAMVVIWFVYT